MHSDGSPADDTLTWLGGSDNPAGESLAVPYIYRSGVRPPAMLLVDDLRYLAVFQPDSPERPGDSPDHRHEGYLALLRRWKDSAPEDPVPRAVVTFFEQQHHRRLKVPEKAKPTDVAAIMVDGEWAHDRESTISLWGTVARDRKASGGTGICLVCGQPGSLLETFPEAVKSGAIPAGSGRGRDAQLVSVNKPAQGRGGIIQLGSAPVCDRCGPAAMSALNALLADRNHRFRTSDSVLTWWLREGGGFPEVAWIDEPQADEVGKLIRTLNEPRSAAAVSGIRPADFYAVTLSVNQSRVVVRDWLEVPVSDVRQRIARWFADHQTADLWEDDPQVVPLWLLAVSTGRWGSENGQNRYLGAGVPDGCQRDLLLTALRGTRPPGYLLPHLLQRIRSDGHIDRPRAALLRLILVRAQDSPKENHMAGLDRDAPYPAYQCGRMFAVLEAIQRTALGREINTTIADKYFPAATATPRAILVMLEKNASGHLRRVRRTNAAAANALKARLNEVMGHLGPTASIPPVLDLEGQARFVLGYHHQHAADLAAARAHSSPKSPEARS